MYSIADWPPSKLKCGCGCNFVVFPAANSISVNYDNGSSVFKSVDFKKPLEIQCNTTETGIRMEWEKDGENITVPKDPRIKISPSRLVIEEPKNEDMGNYSCRTFKQDAKTGEKNILVIGKSTISFAFTKFCLLFCCCLT